MEIFKSGFVTIIGKTNVGKSTLMNQLVGEKIAITANKSQTTRTAIKAIINREHSQIIVIDTPGIHKPKNKLGETMLETAYGSIADVDVIVFMVDAQEREITKGDQILLEKIRKANKPTILVLNKIDLIKKEALLSLMEKYAKEYDFTAVIPVSALKEKDVQILLQEIEKNLQEGPAYYDKEEYTDQTVKDLVAEIIREKALRLLSQEVPHGIFVEVDGFKKKKNRQNEPVLHIDANLYCLRKSHKGMIIGKEGNMLKRIGTMARQELERKFETKIHLKLWVKVKEDWQNDQNFLKNFKPKDV